MPNDEDAPNEDWDVKDGFEPDVGAKAGAGPLCRAPMSEIDDCMEEDPLGPFAWDELTAAALMDFMPLY